MTEDYTYDANNDTAFVKGIPISRNLTIFGNGVTINATDAARIFHVTGGKVVFNNITFANGRVYGEGNSGCGGAILGNYNTSAINCTFTNNFAEDSGGAISQCSATDCIFTNNYADYDGGAIDGGNATNCIFINNSAGGAGGAFSFGIASSCIFINNSAYYGGAMNWECNAFNCTFANNYARDCGGAIYLESNAFNCTFINNYAGECGGAISEGNAFNCTFIINHANDTGNHCDNLTTCINCTEIDSAILNVSDFTTTYRSGEKLPFSLTNATEIIKGAYTKITLLQNGEEYYTFTGQDWPVELKMGTYDARFEIIFSDGSANPHVEPQTVKIEITSDGTTFSDLNRTINNNTDSVINLDKNYTFNPDTDSAFTNGIVIDRPVTINGNGCTIDADGGARIFNVKSDNADLKNITFVNGKAYNGGAILFEGRGNVADCNFTHNSASQYGGAIMFSSAGSVTNCNFADNKVTNRFGGCGGAVYSADNCEVKNCNFTNNNACYYGAVFLSSGQVTNCNFTNNKASRTCGAVCLNNGEVRNCNFINNSAYNFCGAVCFTNAGNVTNCNFTNNTATDGEGGALCYLEATQNNFSITGCFYNNTAAAGAAIFFRTALSNLTIHGNFIANNGSSVVCMGTFGGDCLIHDSIFINSCPVVPRSSFINISAVNSWFGNDAANFNVKPDVGNINMNSWLFLNATANPNPIEIFDSSEVIFKLSLFDGNHGNVSDYDNSLLMPVKLNITSINGDVNVTSVNLGDSIKYAPNSIGKGSVTAAIENVEYTIELNNIKLNPNFSAEDQMSVYGQDVIVSLDYNASATGNVNLTLAGKKHAKQYLNVPLNATILLSSGILPDEYDLTVTYSGDDLFQNASAKAKLTVQYLKSDIKAVGYTINVTDDGALMFTVTLPENATGMLNISNGSSVYVAKSGRKENNSLIVDIMNAAYPVGKYDWTFTYLGDDIYENSSAKATSEILIVKTEIKPANSTIDLLVGDTSKINYTLTPEGALGNVTFTTSDSGVVVVDSSGNLKAVGEGLAVITVEFEENAKYSYSNATVAVNVSKVKATIDLNVSGVFIVGDTVNVTFSLPSDIDGDLIVTVDGNMVVGFTIDNGTVTIPGTYSYGNHTASVSLTGDTKYEDVSASVNFTVNKADPSGEVKIDIGDVSYGDDATFEVTLPDDAGGNVTVSVGDKNYTGDVKDGKATVNVPNLSAGNNTVSVTYSGDDKYNPFTEKVNVTVKKSTPKLAASAKTFKDTDKTKKYTVTLKDANGKPVANALVSLKVNGKTYTAKTNSKGQATFKLAKLTKKGTYTAVITYKGDDNYNKVSKKVKLTVKQTWKTISKGSKDKAMVKKIQIALKSKGYYLTYNGHYLKVDGIYHTYTEMAVKQFQKAKKLKVTGKVDYNTAVKLGLVK